ncbi:MAG: TonB-dependent receptor [Saprospirales bacterium]|nr:MAG: TonB-dependent receptor [Saprospirales bacterium]
MDFLLKSASKYALLFFSLLCFPFFLNGQSASTAEVSGQLMEATESHYIEFANISFLDLQDSSLVTGISSGLDGEFNAQVQPGEYLIRVTFLGYETVWKTIEINEGVNDLGIVHMRESAEVLNEVSVEAAALMFRTEIDKRVYDVQNTISASGGSAVQLLETLPSIQIDDEGQINLRGSSNILIYINGQPTNLSADDTESILEQFPADAIKSVEVITNPSARFDAEGVGGIINLILNESDLRGLNGQINASIGTGNKYSAGFNLNYRANGFNFALGYNYQNNQRWEYSESNRESFRGNISPILDQEYNTTNWDESHLIRPSIEYQFKGGSRLQLSSSINHRARDRERTYQIRSLSLDRSIDSSYVRLLEEDQSRLNWDIGTSFSTSFGRENHNFSVQLRFSDSDQDRIEYFDQEFRNSDDEIVLDKRELQTYERPLNDQLYLFQVDYERPLGVFNFEAGWKSTLNSQFREQIFEEFDFGDNKWENNPGISNQFEFEEAVHAAYAIIGGQNGKWGYQAGLRAEYTNTESFQPKIDSVHTNNYFDLFPSFFITYEPAPNTVFQASYSRRISRPNMWRLMPFINAQDLLNLRLGNPYLDPQYTDNYELSFDKMWEDFFLTASLFHRDARNTFTRVYQLFEDRSSVVTWQNADTRKSTGLEVVKQWFPERNTDLSLTSSLFYSEVIGQNNGERYSNSRLSWTLNMMLNTRIRDWFNLQVVANYRGPIVLPQGSIDPRYSMNIGVRRDFFNRNATVSLSLSDALKTRNFTLNTESSDFNQRRYFERESRILTLSLTYRFRGYQERSDRRQAEINGVDDGVF